MAGLGFSQELGRECIEVGRGLRTAPDLADRGPDGAARSESTPYLTDRFSGRAQLQAQQVASLASSAPEPSLPRPLVQPGSVAELLDTRSIPRLKSWTTHQASGYDRGGGFYDSGNFLRTEPGRRHVLMESTGPGCIDRMWFTYKSRVGQEPYDLLIYLDDPAEPVVRLDLDTLLSGTRAPFLEPLAGRCGNPDHPEALTLMFYWDAAAEAAVSVPFGPFFGCPDAAPPIREVKGLWFGQQGGTFYHYLPMPFRSAARLCAVGKAGTVARVTGEISLLKEWAGAEKARFHARRYDHAPPSSGQDYVVLETPGAGHFAGLVMDRPGHMEGDDRFFVDDQAEPVWHGTGTEDFFNFAWGLGHVGTWPLHGITQQAGGPVCYRVHLPAGLPFQRSLRITWEHGHDPTGGPNLDQRRCSGVVFYYLR